MVSNERILAGFVIVLWTVSFVKGLLGKEFPIKEFVKLDLNEKASILIDLLSRYNIPTP